MVLEKGATVSASVSKVGKNVGRSRKIALSSKVTAKYAKRTCVALVLVTLNAGANVPLFTDVAG